MSRARYRQLTAASAPGGPPIPVAKPDSALTTRLPGAAAVAVKAEYESHHVPTFLELTARTGNHRPPDARTGPVYAVWAACNVGMAG